MWSADEGRTQLLDEYLWTFAQHSFVPHARWTGRGEMDDPVVLVSGSVANPNSADTLVVVDRLDDPSQAAGFTEIHDLVAQIVGDGDKHKLWEQAGFEVMQVAGLGKHGG